MATPRGISGGLLMFRRSASAGLEVYLAHPGEPFFKSRMTGRDDSEGRDSEGKKPGCGVARV